MPDVFSYTVYTDDQSRAEIEQKARDVATFLMWAADPHTQTRYQLGVWVIGYMVVLTFLLWLIKRRVWARLD
jgi:ubiquinol-cytochrome c reductase cytochrome c1 subunit